MDIAEIKKRVELLKTANNKKYCLIPELAKELKVSKTDLMQFILDNPKLFYTDNQWTFKVLSKTKIIVHNKNLGLGIQEVYILPEDNFRTEEWLQVQIDSKTKYIHISEFDYYGVQGYYIEIDKKEKSKYREYLWRNTEAKIIELQSLGITHKDTFYTGGFGDSAAHPVDYAISPSGLKKLDQLGWSYNKVRPIIR